MSSEIWNCPWRHVDCPTHVVSTDDGDAFEKRVVFKGLATIVEVQIVEVET